MPSIKANGISIEYQRDGSKDSPCILLIMGLGAQLIQWPDGLVDLLVKRGFQTIRFDNRDSGLSEKFDDAGVPDIPQMMMDAAAGKTISAPYTLSTMADDAAALLSALDVKKAHIVGASMGGMIAQLMAANHPDRVLSLTSIMSTTGNPDLPQATPEAAAALFAPVDDPDDLDAAIKRGAHIWKTIGSPGFPRSEKELLDYARQTVERSYCPAGMMRQMAAIIEDGDRRARLKAITAPTIVLHGEDDPLVPVEGGADTARSIRGARLRRVPGMGHDVAPGLWDIYAQAICDIADHDHETMRQLKYRINPHSIIKQLRLFALASEKGGMRELQIARFCISGVRQAVLSMQALGENILDREQLLPITPIEHFAAHSTKHDIEKIGLLFNQYGSDKASRHNHHIFYAYILQNKKSSPLNLLEIGLGSKNPTIPSNMGKTGKPGASLKAFKDFLPNANIYGADIDKDILFSETRIKTAFVDQLKSSCYEEMKESLAIKDLDVIIDDGLHCPEANLKTLLFGLSILKNNGWIVIEDINDWHLPIWHIVGMLLMSKKQCFLIKEKYSYLFAVKNTTPRQKKLTKKLFDFFRRPVPLSGLLSGLLSVPGRI